MVEQKGMIQLLLPWNVEKLHL